MGLLKKLIQLAESSTQPAKNDSLSDAVAKEMYDKNLYGYRDMKDSHNYQNKLLDKVNAARERYAKDGDLAAVIAAYEEAFLNAYPPCKSSQWKNLVDYYLKANDFNKAWGYLQKVKLDNMKEFSSNGRDKYEIRRFLDMNEKINMQEARVLKKEKRYEQAVLNYINAHVSRVGQGIAFDKERFLKDISSCVNKLKWPEDRQEYLAYLVQKSAKEQLFFKESEIKKTYKGFLDSVKKEEQ